MGVGGAGGGGSKVPLTARFVCVDKRILDAVSAAVTLDASRAGDDNVGWSVGTPQGDVRLVLNGPAAAVFVEGQRYRLTFDPDD